MKTKSVSLEIAKLAKEKGYKPEREWNPEYVPGYIDYGLLTDEPEKGTILSDFQEEDWSVEGYYLAPDYHTMVMWLMEEKFLQVIAVRDLLGEVMDNQPFYYDNSKWIYSIDDLLITTEGIAQMRGYNNPYNPIQYSTYEEALEAGIIKALEVC